MSKEERFNKFTKLAFLGLFLSLGLTILKGTIGGLWLTPVTITVCVATIVLAVLSSRLRYKQSKS